MQHKDHNTHRHPQIHSTSLRLNIDLNKTMDRPFHCSTKTNVTHQMLDSTQTTHCVRYI